ncbi:MAG: hypothetical protein AB8D52_04055 [Gammaproteobacteria bacterium]
MKESNRNFYKAWSLLLFMILSLGSCYWIVFVNHVEITIWNKSDKTINFIHIDDFENNRYTKLDIKPGTSTVIQFHYTGDGLYKMHGKFSDEKPIIEFGQYLGGLTTKDEIEIHTSMTKLVKSETSGI